ncbi:uncharacterized protein [Arachis hypogaea]|uniref:uncharacterized protein n=1 Tax=Arachis hypogaea TaxID=3818 RepID=UPI0010FC4508|nr:uncharacterized protein LOC114924552 [Arachis hypogaea]
MYKNVIKEAWHPKSSCFSSKLQHVQDDSLEFNLKVVGNIFAKKKELERYISKIQRRLEEVDILSFRVKEKELNDDYNRILLQEELFWFQKSREQWVKFGDRNTKFFHLQSVIRRKNNKIKGLFVGDSTWSFNSFVPQVKAVSFFKNLFCSVKDIDLYCMGDVPLLTLSPNARENLTTPVSFSEVKAAVFGMNSFKAPRPDGFQAFFQRNIGILLERISGIWLE